MCQAYNTLSQRPRAYDLLDFYRKHGAPGVEITTRDPDVAEISAAAV
jgi:hypothetical protein